MQCRFYTLPIRQKSKIFLHWKLTVALMHNFQTSTMIKIKQHKHSQIKCLCEIHSDSIFVENRALGKENTWKATMSSSWVKAPLSPLPAQQIWSGDESRGFLTLRNADVNSYIAVIIWRLVLYTLKSFLVFTEIACLRKSFKNNEFINTNLYQSKWNANRPADIYLHLNAHQCRWFIFC